MSSNLLHDPHLHHPPTFGRRHAAMPLRHELLLIILVKLVALGMLWALMRSA